MKSKRVDLTQKPVFFDIWFDFLKNIQRPKTVAEGSCPNPQSCVEETYVCPKKAAICYVAYLS